jgi:hypothetical protein
MPGNKTSKSNKNFSAKKSSRTSHQSNSNYQSLYLWVSFLWTVIALQLSGKSATSLSSLSFVVRSHNVIPAQAGIQENSVLLNTMRNLLPGGHMEIPRVAWDDNFIITYSTPLILSALTYQQSGSLASGLLFGLGSYITQIKAQITMPALTVNIDSLGKEEGIIFTGGNFLGRTVYAADVNLDGHMDVLTGAFADNKSYLGYGPNFSVTNLDELSGMNGRVFTGNMSTGFTMRVADLNRDGYMDILISAINVGEVYLVYGPEFNNTDLNNLTPQQGVIFSGDKGFGYSIVIVDLNRDDYLDLLIGTREEANKVYLAYGPVFNVTDFNKLGGNKGLIFNGDRGTGVSISVTDFNRDGNLDILIGAHFANKIYLVYGPTFNVTNLNNLNDQSGIIFSGGTYAGVSTYTADMNRDNYTDIVIGAYGASKVYLIYGPVFNVTNLDLLSGKSGVVFSGGIEAGTSVYVADLNGDGDLDILTADPSGKTYLIYGSDFSNSTNLDALNIKQGVIFTNATAKDIIVADMNGDKNLDIFLGSTEGINKVYIIYNHVFNLFPPVTTTSKAATITSVSAPVTLQSTSLSSFSLTAETSTTTQIPAEKTSGSGNSTAAIAGGAAGGVIVLGGAIAACAFWRKKNKNNKEKPAITSSNNANNKEVPLNAIPRTSDYASFQLDRTYTSTRPNYAKVDEEKKLEQQYDYMPKIEI